MVTKYIINNLPSQTITGDLNISEKTIVTSFQMTSGATDGYVLTSDVDGNGTWSKSNQLDSFYVEPSSTSIVWDLSGNSSNYNTILTGDTTLDLINVRNGDYGTMVVIQDGVGGHNLTLGTLNGSVISHLVVNGGSGSITLSSAASTKDIISFMYDGTDIFWSVGLNFN